MDTKTILMYLYNSILNKIGELKLSYKMATDIKTFLISIIGILDEYIENPKTTRIKYSDEILESKKQLFRVN